jgi:hypothetical protein
MLEAALLVKQRAAMQFQISDPPLALATATGSIAGAKPHYCH